MTRIGRTSAVAAAALAAVTAATWDVGTADPARTATGQRGASLFVAKGCSGCHAGPDSSPALSGFPSLADASSWAGSRRPGMTAAAYLSESMTDPSAFRSPVFSGAVGPTSAMPRLSLTSDEVAALVGYLLDG